jgi:signal transduction histidine kinase
MTTTTPTTEEMARRLVAMEQTLERYGQLAVAHQYAAAIMHEVNNPLEAIINLVYLMEREDPLPGRAQERLATIQEQLQLLTHVARSSLTFHRDQAISKEVNLVAVAESALKLHGARITERRVKVNKRYPERAVCNGISGELLQVISNLLLNALDAVKDQTGATLHLRVRDAGGCVHITIADNGTGIPEHVEATLFTPNVTSKRSGTGLGLWLSERILRRHKGKIKVRTSRTEGKSGTVFRISLPHAIAA